MLEDIIGNPDLSRYHVSYEAGRSLFLEGDTSQDLYILVSGQIDVLKGKKKIARITEPGSFIGEMSFLLGERRTSTVNARTAVTAIRIPREDVESFLKTYPEVAREVTMLLARRLAETSRVVYGLKEFADQLPDAVLMTDHDGVLVNWNSAAEEVYGRDFSQMQTRALAELFYNQDDYRDFMAAARSGRTVREQVVHVQHPDRGLRCISASTTVLYDGHHNFQGIMLLGRDVTEAVRIAQRYRRIRRWAVPCAGAALALALVFFIVLSLFFTGRQSRDLHVQELRNQLAKDYLVLSSLLAETVRSRDWDRARQQLNDFFAVQEVKLLPYEGLVLLDENKKVTAFSSVRQGADRSTRIGNSYGGLSFEGDAETIHRVLNLYRTDPKNPMGARGIEVAFPLGNTDAEHCWLLFQIDTDKLRTQYAATAESLESFRFSHH